MEKEIVLKKAIIGGFDRNEVINCIAQLQAQALDNRGEREEIERLNRTVAELEAIVAEKDAEIDRLSAEAQNSSRVSAASARLMRESVDYADHYVESARILAEDISNLTNAKINSAKQTVNDLLLDITRISEDVLALYTSLTELRAEYDSFGEDTPASSDIYLAEDEETVAEDEPQAVPLDAEQDGNSAPHRDVEEAMEMIRRAKEKYQKML